MKVTAERVRMADQFVVIARGLREGVKAKVFNNFHFLLRRFLYKTASASNPRAQFVVREHPAVMAALEFCAWPICYSRPFPTGLHRCVFNSGESALLAPGFAPPLGRVRVGCAFIKDLGPMLATDRLEKLFGQRRWSRVSQTQEGSAAGRVNSFSARIGKRDLASNVLCPTNRERLTPELSVRTA